MADKSTQLILDALTRAAVEPAGMPLLAQKSSSGLFPATSFARTAADRAKSDGLLRSLDTEANGRELVAITDKGKRFLVRQSNPRQVLEDFVRIIEDRQASVLELSRSVTEMSAGLASLRTVVEQVLPRLTDHYSLNGHAMNGTLTRPRPAATAANDLLIADVKTQLAEWHAASEAAHDCPLPDLFRRLGLAEQASVGQFHDALRLLHEDHQIYLHPWTGPLYALPEPAFALMVGHEVAFYASIRWTIDEHGGSK